jgi:hypothetical protein
MDAKETKQIHNHSGRDEIIEENCKICSVSHKKNRDIKKTQNTTSSGKLSK